MSISSEFTIRPTQLKEVLDINAVTGLSTFLWGPPGIGKSEIIAAWAASHDRELIDVRLSQMEPTDLRGIPVPVDVEVDGKIAKRVEWSIPAILPTDPNSRAVLLLDEFNSAMPVCQAACYQLILDRRLGEYKVPEGVIIIAAGNRDTDKGITFRMPTPIANRFVHVELAADFNDWQEHAVDVGAHPSVVGYLSQFKNELFGFDASSATRGWRSPRSWMFVSRLMYAFDEKAKAGQPYSRELRNRLVTGAIGESASQFMTHVDMADKLPASEDILTGKVKEVALLKEPKNAALNYSLATSLCYGLRAEHQELPKGSAADLTAEEKKKHEVFFERLDAMLGFMFNSCTPESCIMVVGLGLKSFRLPLSDKRVTSWTQFRREYEKYVL